MCDECITTLWVGMLRVWEGDKSAALGVYKFLRFFHFSFSLFHFFPPPSLFLSFSPSYKLRESNVKYSDNTDWVIKQQFMDATGVV